MSDTQAIKDKIDVVDLISEYVQLKPSGINHKGLCPFHHEKSPSFMANRERQSWHCFGCGKGGDIFTFVQEIEGMEFPEALRLLANKAGVPLTSIGNKEENTQKTRMKELLAEAARFYHNFLLKMPQSGEALAYLHTRGLTDETIEAWQIGFVPEQWELLTQYLLKKGFGVDDLVAAGLTIKKDGADVATKKGFYDRFRGRIMFPIRDAHGGVVGFTGRVLVETDKSGGKYVNSPQTALYDKSRIVFGLDRAKQEIRKKDLVVLVEGQMDVIACHQAGMTNVVASSGTALTDEQVKLLLRYSSNMAMAFDADDAGVAAAKRGIDLAIAGGMHVRVIQIPDGAGKDPDECLKKNKDVWFQSVERASDVMEWLFSRAFTKRNIADPRQKQTIVDELLPQVLLIPFAVERDYWLGELSQRLRVDVGVLREDMKRIQGLRAKGQSLPARALEQQPVQYQKIKRGVYETLLERFFSMLLRYPTALRHVDRLEPQMITEPLFVPLYESLKEAYTAHTFDIATLCERFRKEGQENLIDVLLMQGELDFVFTNEKEGEREVSETLERLLAEWKRKEREDLSSQIREAEKAGDTVRVEELLKKLG